MLELLPWKSGQANQIASSTEAQLLSRTMNVFIITMATTKEMVMKKIATEI